VLTDKWAKSSYSNSQGNCAEVVWRKSGRSESKHCVECGTYRKASHSTVTGQCTEVGHGDGMVAVRDTKQEHLGYPDILHFTPTQWRTFITAVKGNTWG
jgi:hypothetical protein